MSRHGLEVFDHTFHKTHEWLNAIMHLLNWDDRHKAYVALRSTLQALRDRLPVEIAVKFGAQLPMLVRGFYYEGWKPALTPIKVKSTEEFLGFVSAHAGNVHLAENEDLEQVVRAVFQVVGQHISEGEVHHIKQALPLSVAILWRKSEAAAHSD